MFKIRTLLAVLLLTSCVSVPRDAGLEDVKQAVASRASIDWNADVKTMLGDELTADEAVAIAIANNPRLQRTLAELGIARAELIEASTIANPILELEVRYPGEPYHPYELRLAQTLIDLVPLPRRRAIGRAAFDDRDFAIFLNEWFIKPGASTPDPTVMVDFNTFTFNSRVFPGTAPLLVRTGDRVRIRIANLSMDSHPIHFHGHKFYVTGTDAGPLPQSAWWSENTVNVPVGTSRDIEFIADNPGDWALHCHKTHHVMNQMGHDLPNLIGIDPAVAQERVNELTPGTMVMGTTGMGDMTEHQHPIPRNSVSMRAAAGPFGPIDMGGMFTVLKIRDDMDYDRDPGWYQQPRGTSAWRVDAP